MPVEETPKGKDYSASVVRTLTPIIVGVVLGALGTEIAGVSEATLTPIISAAIAALYHAIVRALENKWPKAGLLLGWAKAPTYPKDAGA